MYKDMVFKLHFKMSEMLIRITNVTIYCYVDNLFVIIINKRQGPQLIVFTLKNYHSCTLAVKPDLKLQIKLYTEYSLDLEIQLSFKSSTIVNLK